MIQIWEPRYSTRSVLIAKYKVKEGINEIIFTKSKALEGKIFTIKGADIRRHPLESNGSINCYAVPIEELE